MSRRFLYATFFVAGFACLLTSVAFNSFTASVALAQTSDAPTLALAFPQDYARKGYFYVNYTNGGRVMRRKCFFVVLFVVVLVLCCADFRTEVVPRAGAQSALPQLALVSPIGGLSSPVGIVNAADGSNRLFIVEQGGRIRIVKNGALLSTPFLNITTRVSTGGERGLLGLAFPPGFMTSKRFYVYYTNPSGDIVIARYRVSSGNADVADAGSEQVLITIPHPGQANHNGGQLAFGPQDGFLYAGTGDGGAGGDPPNNAQNTNVLLGKLLRLDVETGNPTTYTVPSTNPFVGRAGFRPEIWALGVRNSWRFSFDRQTGDLYVADVGQGNYEEIDFQPASSLGGENYGWRVVEGFHCYPPGTTTCNQTGLTLPVVEYDHTAGDCSVTGGYVYRASTYPRMQGLYFYGDFCSGRIWALRRVSSAWQSTLLLDTSFNLTAFGEDEAGNLYAASYSTGEIYSVVDTPPTVSINDVSVTEGNSGQTAATFTVTLSRSPDAAVSVSYHTSDGTAVAPGDYQAASGSVNVNPGQTTASIVVQINGDTADEPDEVFNVTLDGINGPAVFADAQGVALILNDDGSATPTPTPTNLTGLQYYPLAHPVRLLDTRPGASACHTPGAPLGANTTRTQPAAVTCDGLNIPATALAVVGNATVTTPAAGGYITLYPAGAALPTVSNLNYVAGQTVPNAFTVGLGTGGAFNIYTPTQTHFIVDIAGYYAPPGQGGLYYHPLPHPVRLLDTRVGATACDAPGAPLQANASRTETARTTCGGLIIPNDALSVVGNATVVNQRPGAVAGHVTLYPSGMALPNVSNLNYVPGQIVPNAFAVGLGGDGAFNIYAATNTDFIVDVTGYYSASAAVDSNGMAGLLFYVFPTPVRLLDTRAGMTACHTPGAPLAAGSVRTQAARGACAGLTVPASALAVVGNATVVFPASSGYIILYPSGATQPVVSNLNYLQGEIIPNAFNVTIGADGAFNIYTPTQTHFIIDLAGYFAP